MGIAVNEWAGLLARFGKQMAAYGCSLDLKRPARVIAADERPGALTRIHRVRRCRCPTSLAAGRCLWAEASAHPRARSKVCLVLFQDYPQP